MTDDVPPAVRPCPIVAFTSPGATGRTATLTNVACVLAIAGKRVLILDQGVEAPRVHDYLRQFQTDVVLPAHLLGEDLLRELHDSTAGADNLAAYQYRLPMDSGGIDAIAFAGSLSQPRCGHGRDAALRNRIRAAGYDYVLIDIAAAPTPSTFKRLAYLCDTVVVCFHPRTGDMSRAAAIAGAIAEWVPVRLAILAVAVQFDDQDPDIARRAKDRIQTAFGALASATVSTTIAEIPYRPVGVVFDQAIAVLHDEPDRPIPAAYARITHTITSGEIDRIHPVPSRVRDSYRYSLGIGSPRTQPRIFLAYAAEDRLWADWIQHLLESSGAKVGRLPADDAWLAGPGRPAVLVVGSPRLVHSQTGRHALELIDGSARAPGLTDQFDLLVVQIPGPAVDAQLTDLPQVSFVGCPETLARRRLLQHFVLFDRLELGSGERPVYFPGRPAPPHSRSSLPPRNERFVGRGAVLEHMRDRFLSQGEQVVCTLTGPAGTGKSQIALEYAHRFTTDYDLQWWIPAADERSVRASLIALADEMKLPSSPDRPRAALEALRAHPRYQRWLLVYDNVSALDTLAELLPATEIGHVIVTTREPSPDGTAVGALDTEDSIELLNQLVPDLPADDAALVALHMDRLPQALRLAAAWMSESAKAMHLEVATRTAAASWAAAEFQVRTAGRLAGQDRRPAAAVLAVVLATLAESDLGRVAARLAQLCSWLSPDGVALRLLRSTAMVQALADAADTSQALLLEPLELDRVLRCGQRYGLFEMNWERPAKLTMHRVVQALIRESMTLDESHARQREVLHALARFAPTDPEPEDPRDIADFAELQRHIEASGAVSSQDAGVRRWLVDQVSYLARTPSPETWDFALALSARVLDGWNPVSRAESSLQMRLEFQITNLHRQRGEDVKTLFKQMDSLLNRQQELLGPTHPRTLRAWRSKGGYLRDGGKYAEACAAAQRTFHGFREWLGDHHPDTRRAANNLAFYYFLSGDVSSALELEQNNYAVRMALFGPDHLDVCWSACNLGIYLRELGHHEESIKIFDEAVERVGALRPDGGHPDEVRIRWNRAIAYRHAGDPHKALEENAENLRRLQDLYGPNDVRTAACKLSFAIDYHLTGGSAAAARFAEESLTSYGGPDARNPHTALHRLNLAIFRRTHGHRAQARAFSDASLNEMVGWLGPDHPWTLAATINHAHAIAHDGDPSEGRKLLRRAHDDCLDYLPPGHPYTRRATDNLAHDIADWGDLHVDLP
jgi:tetratricopeptide (TPR) repeat protein/MinD-like ATPase involved in chromosome partitioning or flagellar assembly